MSKTTIIFKFWLNREGKYSVNQMRRIHTVSGETRSRPICDLTTPSDILYFVMEFM